MQYVTLITVIHDIDTETFQQYLNSIKTWWKHPVMSEIFLHITVTGSKESKNNVIRELPGVSDDIKLNYQIDYQEGVNNPIVINKMIDGANTPYVGLLPYYSWREPHALQNQITQLKTFSDFTYGDYVTTDNLGVVYNNVNRHTVLEKTYDIGKGKTKQYFQRTYQWGEFLMWKKAVHEHVGYFNEDLNTCYDFEWINRLLENNRFRIGKTGGIMGASTKLKERDKKEYEKVSKQFIDYKGIVVRSFGKEVEWRKP